MRSRSSRLFIVLLHLVGVTTKVSRKRHLTGYALPDYSVGSDRLRSHQSSTSVVLTSSWHRYEIGGRKEEDSSLIIEMGHVYWFEDSSDGRCLGHTGTFSDCGDVSFWLLLRRPKKVSHHCNNPYIHYHQEDKMQEHQESQWWEYEYALLMVDDLTSLLSHPMPNDSNVFTRAVRTNVRKDECLSPIRYNKKHMKGSANFGFHVAPCSLDEAWLWNYQNLLKHGILSWEDSQPLQSSSYDSLHTLTPIQRLLGGPILQILSSRTSRKSMLEHDNEKGCTGNCARTTLTRSNLFCLHRNPGELDAFGSACFRRNEEGELISSHSHFISSIGEASMQSSRGFVHLSVVTFHSSRIKPSLFNIQHTLQPEKKTMNLFQSIACKSLHRNDSDRFANMSRDQYATTSDSLHMHPELKYPTDLLFPNIWRIIGRGLEKKSAQRAIARPKKISSSFSEMIYHGGVADQLRRDMERKDSVAKKSSHDRELTLLQRSRKMPIHPYISASKDGSWEDPRTGLLFDTDLSKYLGRDRHSQGRHTLMGVGLYCRTILKIKIYGVALYVSKRDVLADPFFIPFAHMTAKELTSNQDFYDYLTADNRKVERTLLLKLNIQISVNTMRTSLEADWKLLSPEHKTALIESSFKKRDADDNMLRKITSPENSSRCSCGQSAPDRYQADPTCCGRGTIMSFTWLKNGDMELRIDGRIMDTFQSDGMAKGIFHEYLRGDDPISMEARNNFADGFPFLLSPLAPLSKTPPTDTSQSSIDYSSQPNKTVAMIAVTGLYDIIGSVLDTLEYHREDAFARVEDSADWIISKFVWLREKNLLKADTTASLSSTGDTNQSYDALTDTLIESNESLSWPSASDDIASLIPEMTFSRKVYIITVHLYLILLLIVSFGDSYSTRVMHCKRNTVVSSWDSESDNLERNNSYGNGSDEDSVDSFNDGPSKQAKYGDDDCISGLMNANCLDFAELNITEKPMQKAFSYCL